ncbi:MAG: dTMP kinase [Halobacteriovoraceae bacterium]|nr:dTMP kinase [Halobacteriovoraceae bacterium]
MDKIAELLQKFRPPAFPGSYFISFEGIEGAGKSKQIEKVFNYLEKQKFRVLMLREPGGTIYGEKLRQAILQTKTPLHPLAEAYLFASSRIQLLNEVILKELGTPGTVIVCDRYMDSSLAYQGFARGLGIDNILGIHGFFPLNLLPHVTFFIDISLKTSRERQKARNASKDYFESQGDDFYLKLIEGYHRAAEIFPQRIHTIDGEKNEDDVFKQITTVLDQLLLQ